MWADTRRKGRRYWNDQNNCRAYFDEWARKQGFDPLDPENWYARRLPRRHSLSAKYGMRKAIQLAYPEVDFARWKKMKLKKQRRANSVIRVKRLVMATTIPPPTT